MRPMWPARPTASGRLRPSSAGIAVHHADARVLGEGRRPAVAEAEVERRAEHQHDVGLAQREAARLREGLRMIGGQACRAPPRS